MQPKDFARIQAANPELAAKIKAYGYFIEDTMIPELLKIDRLLQVLVRCGNGRFVCAVQDVSHFIQIIEEHSKLKTKETGVQFQGDYVRDVSLPV